MAGLSDRRRDSLPMAARSGIVPTLPLRHRFSASSDYGTWRESGSVRRPSVRAAPQTDKPEDVIDDVRLFTGFCRRPYQAIR